MMNIKLLSLFSACLAPCLAGAEQGASDSGNQAARPKYDLTLTLKGHNWEKGESALSPDQPVRFNIRNEGQTPVYIFDFFEVSGEPFSLSIIIHDAKGKKMLEFYNPTKVELCSPLKYVRLSQHESYNISFPFNKVIKEKYPNGLPKGEYTVTAKYENNKGVDCFKGTLVSNPVKFTVKE